MLYTNKVPMKKGGSWAKKTVSTQLKNPVYCRYHRFEIKAARIKRSEIIELNSYKKVQKIIAENGDLPQNHNFS
jgi:hypothetical protein